MGRLFYDCLPFTVGSPFCIWLLYLGKEDLFVCVGYDTRRLFGLYPQRTISSKPRRRRRWSDVASWENVGYLRVVKPFLVEIGNSEPCTEKVLMKVCFWGDLMPTTQMTALWSQQQSFPTGRWNSSIKMPAAHKQEHQQSALPTTGLRLSGQRPREWMRVIRKSEKMTTWVMDNLLQEL